MHYYSAAEGITYLADTVLKGNFIMNEDFIKRANIKRNEYLLKTEELFVANKNRWFADFTCYFKDMCYKLRKWQDESAISEVSYLEYTMLYTNFLNRCYTADIFAYGDKSYIDKSQHFVGHYDISDMFVFFDQLWDDLYSMKKQHVGLIPAQEVTNFMMETLHDFYSYLAVIARSAIKECTDKSPLNGIIKNEVFMVNVGDYMFKTETVYAEKKNKNAYKLAGWFSAQLKNKYFFGDYSNLDFSEKAFLSTDFRFACFRGSTLHNTAFDGSTLFGVNFRNANMEGCSLNNCSIHEADFSNAKLKNASFRYARAKAGLANKKYWKYVGFLPANFRNADLTNADFTKADLTGADFTGATLTGTIFTGATLTGTIFDGGIMYFPRKSSEVSERSKVMVQNVNAKYKSKKET